MKKVCSLRALDWRCGAMLTACCGVLGPRVLRAPSGREAPDRGRVARREPQADNGHQPVGFKVHRRRPGDAIRDHSRRQLPRHQATAVRFALVGLRQSFSVPLCSRSNLRDLGCKTVANMIKGKSPEEIRKLFNIVNDFTPEEEVRTSSGFFCTPLLTRRLVQAQIKKENVSAIASCRMLWDRTDSTCCTGMGGGSLKCSTFMTCRRSLVAALCF